MQLLSFPTSDLPVGLKLGSTVYDARQIKLLAAGVEITRPLIEGLQRRRIASVMVSPADVGRMLAFKPQGTAKNVAADRRAAPCPYESEQTRAHDEGLELFLTASAQRTGPEFRDQLPRPGAVAYAPELMGQAADSHEKQIEELGEIARNISRGGGEEVGAVEEATRDLLSSSRDDIDLFVNLGGTPSGGGYPTRHSRHAAMIATAVGAEMGLDGEQLHHLALGCLLHDLGMLALDPRLVKSQRYLADEEFVEIMRHPIRTFDALAKHLDRVPPAARMVAYQMHERFDGSGYPRRRAGAQIHLFARIAAIADTYVALVAPRPHRSGLLPYWAATKLVKDTAAGKFDPTITRAFLRAVCLFPIGSYIELSGDRVARVLRGNPHAYDRPIVELWNKGAVDRDPGIADLSQDQGLKVLQPLERLA